jgi:hypothetical protein
MSSKPHDRTSESPRTRSPHRLHRSLAWPKTAVWRPSPTTTRLGGYGLEHPKQPETHGRTLFPKYPFTASAPPYYTRGAFSDPRSSGNFSAFRVYSFGGLPEMPVIGRDNMSGLKNWPVFESGHVRYRKPSPPITFGGRIRPFLTCFLRIEPDFMFLGRFGTFPLFCHVDMSNGRLAYVLPPVTCNTHFSTIFNLPWFVCTRMDIVPCAGAMYNISDRNEPFPFHCWPFPFFVQGYIPNGRSASFFASHDL